MKAKIVTPYAPRYGEFPDLLFGTSGSGTIYFDASIYIKLKGDSKIHSVSDFFRRFSFWTEAVKEAYALSDDDLCRLDAVTGHTLIDESLALLFVAYIDSGFGIYMLERISEMLLDGIVLSDTRIMQIIRDRLTRDEILLNFKEEQE